MHARRARCAQTPSGLPLTPLPHLGLQPPRGIPPTPRVHDVPFCLEVWEQHVEIVELDLATDPFGDGWHMDAGVLADDHEGLGAPVVPEPGMGGLGCPECV